MHNCIFCQITQGNSPCEKVFENDKVLAFLDIAPFNKGHILVIPKEHHEDLLSIPGDTLADMMTTVQMLAAKLKQSGLAQGFNVLSNNGSVAGQTVFHSHIHIIPRLQRTEIPFRKNSKRYHSGEMTEIGNKLR